MFNKNNGSNENNRLQNQFTAYLKKAVHFRRIRYLTDRSRITGNELSLTESEFALPDKTDIIQEIADYEAMQQAMKSIKEKERRIVLDRIVEEKSFDQIADELGMTYKAVTSLYYRVLKKLRQHMEGGEKK